MPPRHCWALDDDPGELDGFGPIPPQLARRIAGDATWRRILTDPVSGVLLDHGTTTYSPPSGLAAHVVARDGTCRGPGCRQPAGRCDLDHRIPFPDGATSAANLHVLLCRRHHRAKTEAGWTYTLDAEGNLTWTSPTGHVTTHRPHQLAHPPPAEPQRDLSPVTESTRSHDLAATSPSLPDHDHRDAPRPRHCADGRLSAPPPPFGLHDVVSASPQPAVAAGLAG